MCWYSEASLIPCQGYCSASAGTLSMFFHHCSSQLMALISPVPPGHPQLSSACQTLPSGSHRITEYAELEETHKAPQGGQLSQESWEFRGEKLEVNSLGCFLVP